MSTDTPTPQRYINSELDDTQLKDFVYSDVFKHDTRPLVICSIHARKGPLATKRAFFHHWEAALVFPLSTRHQDVFIQLGRGETTRMSGKPYKPYLDMLTPGSRVRILCQFVDSHDLIRNVIDPQIKEIFIVENGSLCFVSYVKDHQ